MKKIYDAQFKTDITIVGQGEFFVSSSGDIMTTTLGSCIAVCLFDPMAKTGGINHYMLPGPVLEENDIVFGKAKYGINSMEVLINTLLKSGCKKENFQAKVFGGANMFSGLTDDPEMDISSVGNQNILFARKYLDLEDIPIKSEDVGGNSARKIYFDPTNGFVKLFRIGRHQLQELKKTEFTYNSQVKEREIPEKEEKKTNDLNSKIVLF